MQAAKAAPLFLQTDGHSIAILYGDVQALGNLEIEPL